VAVVARRASPPAAARHAAAPRPAAGPAAPLPPPRRVVVRRAGPSGQEAEGRFDINEEEKLSQDFDYLGNKVKDTTDLLNPELKGCSLYLIGMMGSGKSTVGRMLANTLRRARALCVLLLQLLSLPLLSLPRSLLRSLSPLPLYLVDGWCHDVPCIGGF
jgi:ABC-type glutathione transport system ATPase component